MGLQQRSKAPVELCYTVRCNSGSSSLSDTDNPALLAGCRLSLKHADSRRVSPRQAKSSMRVLGAKKSMQTGVWCGGLSIWFHLPVVFLAKCETTVCFQLSALRKMHLLFPTSSFSFFSLQIKKMCTICCDCLYLFVAWDVSGAFFLSYLSPLNWLLHWSLSKSAPAEKTLLHLGLSASTANVL